MSAILFIAGTLLISAVVSFAFFKAVAIAAGVTMDELAEILSRPFRG